MSSWTPTTEQVRYGYSCDPVGEYLDPIGAPALERASARAFDRWLAEERRTAAEKALAEVRSTIGAYNAHGVWAFDQAVKCIERAKETKA